jgi:cellulose synthase/poly-beta-1,6-N-acetylglucosamine synthase-like glycosyltransferase
VVCIDAGLIIYALNYYLHYIILNYLIGTRPDKEALYKMYRALEVDPQIGAVTGFISIRKGPYKDEF